MLRSVSEPENFGFEVDTRDQGKPYDELLNLAKQRGGMLIGGSDDPAEAARERAASMDYEDFYKQAKQTGGLITGEGEEPGFKRNENMARYARVSMKDPRTGADRELGFEYDSLEGPGKGYGLSGKTTASMGPKLDSTGPYDQDKNAMYQLARNAAMYRMADTMRPAEDKLREQVLKASIQAEMLFGAMMPEYVAKKKQAALEDAQRRLQILPNQKRRELEQKLRQANMSIDQYLAMEADTAGKSAEEEYRSKMQELMIGRFDPTEGSVGF